MIAALCLGLATATAAPRWQGTAAAQGTAHIGPVTDMNLGAGGGVRVSKGWLGADLTLGIGSGIARRPTIDATGGVEASWLAGSWQPALGLEAASLWGRPLQIITPDQGATLYRPPVIAALRLRLRPLVFVGERYSISALGLSIGPGIGSGGTSVHVQALQLRVPLGSG